MSTLAERVVEAKDAAGVNVQQIADACGISVQAVYDWINGASLEMKGNNLVRFSELTGYTEEYVRTGRGPKKRGATLTEEQTDLLAVTDKLAPYHVRMLVKIAETMIDPSPPAPGT